MHACAHMDSVQAPASVRPCGGLAPRAPRACILGAECGQCAQAPATVLCARKCAAQAGARARYRPGLPGSKCARAGSSSWAGFRARKCARLGAWAPALGGLSSPEIRPACIPRMQLHFGRKKPGSGPFRRIPAQGKDLGAPPRRTVLPQGYACAPK